MAKVDLSLPLGVKEKRLSFTNHKGERLTGVYVDTGSRNVMILCHGYMANSSMCQFIGIAATLAREKGISTFRFDHPCAILGESERKGPFLLGNHEDEVEDIRCAVKYLTSLGKLVQFLLGHSKGGINAIRYAATVSNVPYVISLAGRFNVQEGTKARFGKDIIEKLKQGPIPQKERLGLEWTMTYEDVMNRMNQPMEEYALKIKELKNVELLCLHGRHDATIPYQESELCARLTGGKFVLVDGDHNFTNPEHAVKMIEALIAFVDEANGQRVE